MARWQPLSKRGTKPSAEEDFLYEGVPAHLAQPMLHWLNSLFEDTYDPKNDRRVERRAHRIAARLRLDIQQFHLGPRGDISSPRRGIYRGKNPASQTLVALAKQDVSRHTGFSSLFGRRSSANAAMFLDIIDAALADGVNTEQAAHLERLLAEGGSAWRVADGTKALEKRVDPTATEALQAISDTTAGTHLSSDPPIHWVSVCELTTRVSAELGRCSCYGWVDPG